MLDSACFCVLTASPEFSNETPAGPGAASADRIMRQDKECMVLTSVYSNWSHCILDGLDRFGERELVGVCADIQRSLYLFMSYNTFEQTIGSFD